MKAYIYSGYGGGKPIVSIRDKDENEIGRMELNELEEYITNKLLKGEYKATEKKRVYQYYKLI